MRNFINSIKRQSIFVWIALILFTFACQTNEPKQYEIAHDIEIGASYPFECSYFYSIDCSQQYVIAKMRDSSQADTFPIAANFCDSIYSLISKIGAYKDNYRHSTTDGLFFFINYKDGKETKNISFRDVPPDFDCLGLKGRNPFAYVLYMQMKRFAKNKNCIP